MRQLDRAIAQAWESALAKALPTIGQAAYQRAVIGWEEPVFHAGKLVGQRRRYSDSLLRLLLTRGERDGRKRVAPGSEEADALAHDAARLAGASSTAGRAAKSLRKR